MSFLLYNLKFSSLLKLDTCQLLSLICHSILKEHDLIEMDYKGF